MVTDTQTQLIIDSQNQTKPIIEKTVKPKIYTASVYLSLDMSYETVLDMSIMSFSTFFEKSTPSFLLFASFSAPISPGKRTFPMPGRAGIYLPLYAIINALRCLFDLIILALQRQ